MWLGGESGALITHTGQSKPTQWPSGSLLKGCLSFCCNLNMIFSVANRRGHWSRSSKAKKWLMMAHQFPTNVTSHNGEVVNVSLWSNLCPNKISSSKLSKILALFDMVLSREVVSEQTLSSYQRQDHCSTLKGQSGIKMKNGSNHRVIHSNKDKQGQSKIKRLIMCRRQQNPQIMILMLQDQVETN